MRGGGYLIERKDLPGWANKNKSCTIKVSAPGYEIDHPPRTLTGYQVLAKSYDDIVKDAGMSGPGINVKFESDCDYSRNYGEYGPGPV
jgi:hypothetical protein